MYLRKDIIHIQMFHLDVNNKKEDAALIKRFFTSNLQLK